MTYQRKPTIRFRTTTLSGKPRSYDAFAEGGKKRRRAAVVRPEGSGLRVERKLGTQVDDDALFAAYAALKWGKDVTVDYQGAKVVMKAGLPGAVTAASEVPRQTQLGVMERFATIQGANHLSYEEKIALGTMTMRAAEMYGEIRDASPGVKMQDWSPIILPKTS